MAVKAAPGLDTAFKRWVRRHGGVGAVARDLGVKRRSVDYWLRRDGWPKVDLILALITLSRGELTFARIVESTCPPHKYASLPKSVIRDGRGRKC